VCEIENVREANNSPLAWTSYLMLTKFSLF
jgi:hypothetical protein